MTNIEHLKRFVNQHASTLPTHERGVFDAQVKGIDWTSVAKAIEQQMFGGNLRLDACSIQPVSVTDLEDFDTSELRDIKSLGENALRQGKVAAFTAAGGQGTRLGFSGPKGILEVTPISHKSLFQVFYEKIQASAARYGHPIHWFLMTSEDTHQETVAFFENRREIFDLTYIHFLKQGQMPAIDEKGDFLFEKPGKLLMNPDGHGGIFQALVENGTFDLIDHLGIEHLSYFQVDNPLIYCIDPYFIGLHILKNSDMSSKVVCKQNPEEKVGMFVQQDGKMKVIEYLFLPKELAEKRTTGDTLLYNAGNIAAHILSVPFAKIIAADGTKLPFHSSRKVTTACNSHGQNQEIPVVKFERFIFDALPYAKNPVVMKTQRHVEFSPIKNKTGIDSLETCQKDFLKLYALWLTNANQSVPLDKSGVPTIGIEIAPTFAESEEVFVGKWSQLVAKPNVDRSVYLA